MYPPNQSVIGLDIGSNTFSCAEIRYTKNSANPIELIDDASLPVRLSEGLIEGGRLKPVAVKRGLDALTDLAEQFDIGNKPIRAVATAVLRKTSRPEDFIKPAEEILKTKIEIISGEEEAELTCKGAVCGIPDSPSWIVMDVGGQSTEVGSRGSDGQWHGFSLDFGVVSLTEKFVFNDPPKTEEMASVSNEVRKCLYESLSKDLKGNLLGVAGTATTLGMLSLGAVVWNREKVHGLDMSLEDVMYWKSRISSVTAKERTEKYNIRPLRADVFPSGICIIEEMIRFLGKDRFTISANGLRIGVALSILENIR